MDDVSRRRFLTIIPSVTLIPAVVTGTPRWADGAQETPPVPEVFPRQAAEMAREIVGVSHSNLVRVKELVAARPALARASWDWGYGDWETALGAASHVGNKEIAAVLLAAGAHPTIFSAAMLGQLETVKAFIAATPGIQKTRGPHGIPLMDHARAGEATEVVKFLESVGDAEPRYPSEPLIAGDPDALHGTYVFGAGATDRLVVSTNSRGQLVMKREGGSDQRLFHHGGRVFNPPGAEAVRIRFEPVSGAVSTVEISDGVLQVRGKKSAAG